MKKLFGNSVVPSCTYCQYGRATVDPSQVLCRKYGPVSSSYSCKKFLYAPTKRTPKKPPKLEEFSEDDFKL